jgi:hypothetical protein
MADVAANARRKAQGKTTSVISPLALESKRQGSAGSRLNRDKGRLLLRQGHPEAAEELFRKALSIATEQQAKLWELGAVAVCVGIDCAFSGWRRILDQAARSIGLSVSFWVRVCHPSTLRIVI